LRGRFFFVSGGGGETLSRDFSFAASASATGHGRLAAPAAAGKRGFNTVLENSTGVSKGSMKFNRGFNTVLKIQHEISYGP
jgi:hypothetical protein